MSRRYSIEDLERKIPAAALASLQANFAPADVRAIYEAIRSPRQTTFRLNPLRITRHAFIEELKRAQIKFQEVQGLPFAFFLHPSQREGDLEKSALYQQGKLYLQGLSGMLPMLFLAPRPGERILDAAAAPGSKTTLMAALMQNQGTLDALEPDFIRLERLKFNCGVLGVTNVLFHQRQAERFTPEPPLLYDAILADLPCSGEGRFNLADRASYFYWTPESVEKLARLQLKILRNCWRLLRPGGRLVYSTCTLNRRENQEVLEQFASECGDNLRFVLPPIAMNYPEIRRCENRYVQILPSARFEGFFVAGMTKLKE